ncbi:MAG TPA: choice-of-anchor Q domain-containing protein, partial [Chthoniobacterales bacterium]
MSRLRLGLIVLGIWLAGSMTASAATFNIANGDVNGLKNAITACNTNGADDVINLATNGSYVFTAAVIGSTSALPAIGDDANHSLTINGNGAALTRSGATGTPNFNLLNILSGARVALNDLLISNGKLTTGSGAGISSAGTLTLNGCTVFANSISGGNESASASGAGISSGGALTIINSTIGGNTASAVQFARGGGISVTGPCIITGSTISANSITSAGGGTGGGIRYTNDLTLINSTVSSNIADGPGSGGGIYGSGNLTLVNCTITRNAAIGDAGGGVAIQGAENVVRMHPRNTIIAVNSSGSATSGPDVAAPSGAIASDGHNLIGAIDGSNGWNATDLTGTSVVPLDPRLDGALANNGGPTFTHRLRNSPAIDAGDNSVLGTPFNLTTDQRGAGFGRMIGTAVDIGAYEATISSATVTTTDDHDDGVCNVSDCTLREALNLANSNPDITRISFASGVTGTINLTSFLSLNNAPSITTPLQIVGPGADRLTIRRDIGGNYRIFWISNGTEEGP